MSATLWKSTLFLSVVAVVCSFSFASAQTPKAKPISEEELGEWLNRHYDCPPDAELHFWRLDYHDFKGDGNEEAIAVASTCETGTAGPDVHSVFVRDPSGELVELKIPEPDKAAYDSLFGNRNSDFAVKDGLLVQTFEDDIDRDPPLIIKYKWNGKEFTIVSLKKTGVFKTSYDCAKAVGEVENAICHVKQLADLDVQLDSVYRSVLMSSSSAERASLRAEQQAWIAKRDKDCAPYKSWVECLTICYQGRIKELKKRPLDAPPAIVTPK
jgi:uncharacterized protein YecT (DUF1311 family)